MTSISPYDSQVAILLSYISHDHVVNLYDLMDPACGVPKIRQVSCDLGHFPLIDVNPRSNHALKRELTANQLMAGVTIDSFKASPECKMTYLTVKLRPNFGEKNDLTGSIYKSRGMFAKISPEWQNKDFYLLLCN